MTKDEALHKALKVLNCLNNDRVYETAWVKGAINACEEALEQPKNTQPLDEVIEEFMKDPAMKQAMDKAREKLSPLFSHPTPQTTQEHSMTKKCMRGTDDMMPWTHIIADFLEQGKDWDLKEVAEVLRNAQAKIDSLSKEWQGLSDDEIDRIYCEVSDNCVKYFPSELYAAWFKALKEKNI